jgi:hypothetical protein
MTDQITGMSDRRHDCGAASSSRPAVKIVVGHGTPNVGIVDHVRC